MIWQMTNPTSPPPSVRAPAGSRRVCCPVRRTSSPTPSKTAMSSRRSSTTTRSYKCANVLKQTLLSLTHCLMLCSRLSTSLFFSPFSSLIMRSSRLWKKDPLSSQLCYNRCFTLKWSSTVWLRSLWVDWSSPGQQNTWQGAKLWGSRKRMWETNV